jgi:hypothetical protein
MKQNLFKEDTMDNSTQSLIKELRAYAKTMTVQATLKVLLEKAADKLDSYQNTPPLQLFAEQEAEFRLNQIDLQREIAEQFWNIPSAKAMDDLWDTAKQRLSDYLMYNKNALNYDGMDDILRGAISDTAARFQKEMEEENRKSD